MISRYSSDCTFLAHFKIHPVLQKAYFPKAAIKIKSRVKGVRVVPSSKSVPVNSSTCYKFTFWFFFLYCHFFRFPFPIFCKKNIRLKEPLQPF